MNKIITPLALVLCVILVFGVTMTASSQSVVVDISASATSSAVTISGFVIPNPGANQEVDVFVNNPNGVTVLQSVVSVNSADGSYSYSSPVAVVGTGLAGRTPRA